jgi:hypothetical protein
LGLLLHAWPAVQATQVPAPLHTWFDPQLVPADLLPESTQVWLPVLQEVVPVRQMPGLLVQAWPAVHATQPPEPLHTWLVPQLVPAGSFPVASMHTCAPELHDVVPSLHVVGLVVHDWPAVHDTQLPEPLHTWLVPQLVPAALFPESAHTCAPEAHVVWPVRQVLGLVVQLRPAVHETHAPLPSQTWLVPQLVPADLLAPSTQVVVPVLQLVVPCLHAVGFAAQFCPAVQVPQKPAPSHTWLVPQLVPADFGLPSVHTGLPVVHDTTPLAQLALGFVVHAAPCVQGRQEPLPLQTWLVPQLVPPAFGVPLVHTGPPLLQEMTPLKHAGLGLVVQEAPSVHATQFPNEEQTWLVPQLAPVAFGVPFTHVDAPLAQEVVPVKHGFGLVVHAWPAVQLTHAPAPSHTWLLPQLVPAERLPESTHCSLPEVQEVTPVRHAPGFVVQA